MEGIISDFEGLQFYFFFTLLFIQLLAVCDKQLEQRDTVNVSALPLWSAVVESCS